MKMTYLETEILESLVRKVNSYKNPYTTGRRVNIVSGVNKGESGVIQGFSHDNSKPLLQDKVRVWLDGFSCVDIFDFDKSQIEVIPYTYIPNLGYF